MTSALQYLGSVGVGSRFQFDTVQSCTRARHSQNLANISGFASLTATASSKSTSIHRGNVRLIERLIEQSEADLHVESHVEMISSGHERRWRLLTTGQRSALTHDSEAAEFDVVIIAAPLQSSKMVVDNIDTFSDAALPPYVESHVTHFITPREISLSFLGFQRNTTLPDDLLTTTTRLHNPHILSISTEKICYKRGCSWDDDCDQCGYEKYSPCSLPPISRGERACPNDRPTLR